MRNKALIGLTELVKLVNGDKSKKVVARIDTGATQSSIDTSLATRLNLGPIISSKIVRSTHGTTMRAVVKASVVLAKRRIRAKFNVADRRHMRYKVLIGRNVLSGKGFLIDPDKK
ncbi:ATP-dependent zinc protease [Candidatus Woesearchaeota archaeon]|nr:ATP-dependent zinc protease [Candidatus Woesearchaeota archaeon]